MNTTGKADKHGPYWSAILDLDQSDFPNPWSPADWEQLEFKHHTLYSLCEAGGLVGFSLFQTLPGDSAAHLLKICLRSLRRGTGASKEFWDFIASDLTQRGFHSVYLEVALNNTRAIAFYRKLGFRELRVIRGYYSNGDDALTMDLTL